MDLGLSCAFEFRIFIYRVIIYKSQLFIMQLNNQLRLNIIITSYIIAALKHAPL